MKPIFLALILLSTLQLSAQKNKKENKASEIAILKLHQKKLDWMVNKQYGSLQMVLENQLLYVHSNG